LPCRWGQRRALEACQRFGLRSWRQRRLHGQRYGVRTLRKDDNSGKQRRHDGAHDHEDSMGEQRHQVGIAARHGGAVAGACSTQRRTPVVSEVAGRESGADAPPGRAEAGRRAPKLVSEPLSRAARVSAAGGTPARRAARRQKTYLGLGAAKPPVAPRGGPFPALAAAASRANTCRTPRQRSTAGRTRRRRGTRAGTKCAQNRPSRFLH
jgi:hypothetical protein